MDIICDNCGKSWEDWRRGFMLPDTSRGTFFKRAKHGLTLCHGCWLCFRYGSPDFVPPDPHTADLWKRYHEPTDGDPWPN